VAATPPPVVTPPPPKPPAPPPQPAREPSGEGWSNALIIAIVVTVLLIGGGIAAAIILSGSDPEPAAKETPQPKVETPQAQETPDAAAALKRQVVSLDRLMKRSARGRAAAVEGDFPAAIDNREGLLRSLQRLRRQADDGELKAALTSFTAAIREALRQNRDCESACPTKDLERVGKLKQDALDKINPLLEAQELDTYTSADI
jgi:flagellar basal body-associated protein FliL